MKRALRMTLGSQCLIEQQLTTILVEVEAVVNTHLQSMLMTT